MSDRFKVKLFNTKGGYMKILLAVILGVFLGISAMYMVIKPYQTNNESDVRLYDNVVAR